MTAKVLLFAAFLAADLLLTQAACVSGKKPSPPPAKAFGSAITLIGGDKQVAGTGQVLDQPVVVQVNDEKGVAVAGALVEFDSPTGATISPAYGLTGSDGQLTVTAALGGMSGQSLVRAVTHDKSGKAAAVNIDEIALGYQQALGREIGDKYCSRCHDSDSTAERVSNHDNLDKPPHSFNDGATYNAITDANLMATINHGGPALGKSPEMPPFGDTLSKSDVNALVAYIRAVADPPYRSQGVSYGDSK
jgi:mono/diheme cytochrome c family protein